MKKIIVLAMALFTSFGAYCQTYANIYASKIGGTFSKGSSIKMNKKGRLILYNGNEQTELYIRKWTQTGCFVYLGNKLVDIKQLQLDSTDYCILRKKGEKYTLCVRGEKSREFEVKLSPHAIQYFDKYSSPSHSAHISHYSSGGNYPQTHASHYSGHTSHYSSGHASHYSSY